MKDPTTSKFQREHLLSLLQSDDYEGEPGDIAFAVNRLRIDIILEAAQRMADGEFSNAKEAVDCVGSDLESALRGARNGQMAAKAEDVQDITKALGLRLAGSQQHDLTSMQGTVLVCERVTVMDALEAVRAGVAGIIVNQYNPLSHSAIILQGAGIPVAYGLETLEPFSEGVRVLIDGKMRRVILEPDEGEICALAELKRNGRFAPSMVERISLDDGTEFTIRLNCSGSFEDLPQQMSIGLLRTEFFCEASGRMPSEQSLTAEYAALASRHPLTTIRLLDIGGDKPIQGFEVPPAPNPALGMRGVRLLLSDPEAMKKQLRAILRASAVGKVRVLVPMVTSPLEMREVRKAMELTIDELRAQDVLFDPDIPLGAMIETPAAAILADKVAVESDFASIGTNDLLQYTLVADRGSPEMQRYLTGGSEAVLRLVKNILDSFAAAGKQVCVCGEMAASPEGLRSLIDVGVQEISINIEAYEMAEQVIKDVHCANNQG